LLTLNGGVLGATTNVASPTNRVGGIIVNQDFQIGISGSQGNASSTANMTFSGTGNSVSLGSSRRTITLGNSGSMTFGGAIAGSGGLTLTRLASGSGWFALSGTNTFTGGLTLDGVRVNASASNTALGAGDVTIGGATGRDTILNVTSGVTLGNTITFADFGGVKTLANFGANATISGPIVNDDNTGTIRIGAGSARTFTLSGGLGGSGSTDWYFGGSSGVTPLTGTVVIGAQNNYSGSGNTTIADSTVRLTTDDGLATNNLTLSGSGTLDLGGGAQAVAELTGDATSKIQSTSNLGTLFVGNGDTSSIFDGLILGSGLNNVALQKTGTGSLELTNTGNTFTGGVTVQDGDLIVSASTLKGQAVNLQLATSEIEFKQSSSGTFSGAISGAGFLTKTGTGSLMLSGANTYSGDTTVSAGLLQGTTLSLQGNIVNNAAVEFTDTTDGTYAGIISGSTGSLSKSGAGIVTLTGANTYGGGTTITDGGLSGNTTSLQGNFATSAGTSLTFNQATTATFSGVVSGSGSLIKDGAGELTLTGANSYSGGTTVSAGTLKGAVGSIQGDIVNESAVEIVGAGNFSGDISGTGTLTKSGAGDLTLSGSNSYAGVTTVSGGNLIGSTDSLVGDISVAAGTLVKFNQGTSATYAGLISGAGGLTKLGSGALTLDQAQTYTGATVVEAGALLLKGDLATSGVTVNSVATLGGTGNIASGSLTVNGTLNPGDANGPGTLEAAGITLGATSTTEFSLVNDPDNSGGAGVAGIDYDTVIARSQVVYGGSLVIRFENSGLYDTGTFFDLFDPGALSPSGNFAGITSTGDGPYSSLTFQYYPSDAGTPARWISGYSFSPATDQYLVFLPSTGKLVIVPEPSTWAMTVMSVGFAGWMARRKKLAMKRRMA
jgi:autotransporter-associated beta strand protein